MHGQRQSLSIYLYTGACVSVCEYVREFVHARVRGPHALPSLGIKEIRWLRNFQPDKSI